MDRGLRWNLNIVIRLILPLPSAYYLPTDTIVASLRAYRSSSDSANTLFQFSRIPGVRSRAVWSLSVILSDILLSTLVTVVMCIGMHWPRR